LAAFAAGGAPQPEKTNAMVKMPIDKIIFVFI